MKHSYITAKSYRTLRENILLCGCNMWLVGCFFNRPCIVWAVIKTALYFIIWLVYQAPIFLNNLWNTAAPEWFNLNFLLNFNSFTIPYITWLFKSYAFSVLMPLTFLYVSLFLVLFWSESFICALMRTVYTTVWLKDLNAC